MTWLFYQHPAQTTVSRYLLFAKYVVSKIVRTHCDGIFRNNEILHTSTILTHPTLGKTTSLFDSSAIPNTAVTISDVFRMNLFFKKAIYVQKGGHPEHVIRG